MSPVCIIIDSASFHPLFCTFTTDIAPDNAVAAITTTATNSPNTPAITITISTTYIATKIATNAIRFAMKIGSCIEADGRAGQP